VVAQVTERPGAACPPCRPPSPHHVFRAAVARAIICRGRAASGCSAHALRLIRPRHRNGRLMGAAVESYEVAAVAMREMFDIAATGG